MLFTLGFRKVFVFRGSQQAINLARIFHFQFDHPTVVVWILVDLFGLVIR